MHENDSHRERRTRIWRTAGATASVATAGLALAAGLAACSSSSSSAHRCLRQRQPGCRRHRLVRHRRRAAADDHAHRVGLGTADSRHRRRRSSSSTRRSRSTWSTRAPARPSTPSWRTRSRPAPAPPTSPRSSTTRSRSSRCQGALADLSADGLGSAQSQFSQAVWDSVNVGGKLVALPQDTGPMALFYNETIFEKYGLTVPTTWAQYAADAAKLHAANPKEYIATDTGDPGFVTSMIWAAGGNPYTVSGTKNVTINLQDPGAKKFAALWSPLITKGLLAPVTSWSTQWYNGLANGSIASLVTGAWMGVDLETGVPLGQGRLAGRAAARVDRGDGRHLGERRQRRLRPRLEQEPARGGRVPAVPEHRPGRADLGQLRRLPVVQHHAQRGLVPRPGPGLLRRPEDQPGPLRRPRPRSCPAGPTCPSRSTPTASSRTRSARPTPASPALTRPAGVGSSSPPATAPSRGSASAASRPQQVLDFGRAGQAPGRPPPRRAVRSRGRKKHP